MRGHGAIKKIPLNSPKKTYLIRVGTTYSFSLDKTDLGCWDCLRAVNLQTYCETAPLQRTKQHPETTKRSQVNQTNTSTYDN